MPLDASTQIQITFGGATLNVWDEGTEEDFRQDGDSKVRRRVRCAWSDRINVVNALLTKSQNVAGTNLYVAGYPYPDAPWLVCREARIRGEGRPSVGPNNLIAYERAEIELLFESWLYDQNGIGSIDLDFTSCSIATAQDKPTFKWGDGTNIPPAQTPVITFSTTKITLERQMAILPPVAAYQNRRNSAPIFGFPDDTVVFWGCRTHRVLTILGATNYFVTYLFEYNSHGWNKLYRPEINDFDTFKFTSGTDLFPATDLNGLLT